MGGQDHSPATVAALVYYGHHVRELTVIIPYDNSLSTLHNVEFIRTHCTALHRCTFEVLKENTNVREEHAVRLERRAITFWELCGWPPLDSTGSHKQVSLMTEPSRWQLSTKLLHNGLLANTLHTLDLSFSAEVYSDTVLPCLTHARMFVGLLQGLRVLRLGPQVRSSGLLEEQLPVSQVHAFLDAFPNLDELSTGYLLVQNDLSSTHAFESHLSKQLQLVRHQSLKTLCMFPKCVQALSSLLSRCSDSLTDLKLFNTADTILLPVIPGLCPHLRSLAYDGPSRPDPDQVDYWDWQGFFAQMPDLTSLEVSGIKLPPAVYFAVINHCPKLQIIKDDNSSQAWGAQADLMGNCHHLRKVHYNRCLTVEFFQRLECMMDDYFISGTFDDGLEQTAPLPMESIQEPSVPRSICPFQYLVSLELTQVHLLSDDFNNSLRNAIRLMGKLKVLTIIGCGLTRHAVIHHHIYKHGWEAREDHPSEREKYEYPIERLTMYTFAEELSDYELKEWVRLMPLLTSMELASGQGYNRIGIASIRMGTIPPMVPSPHGYRE
ncbi:hypothetical protein BGZ75_003343 [Mortierella antarctica]|nr:hypothetical protein BGZ75_003343 [Mortierella antarctica]